MTVVITEEDGTFPSADAATASVSVLGILQEALGSNVTGGAQAGTFSTERFNPQQAVRLGQELKALKIAKTTQVDGQILTFTVALEGEELRARLAACKGRLKSAAAYQGTRQGAGSGTPDQRAGFLR